jgi:site-specific DNA-methyltransferase (adenine-specific)
MNRTTQKVMFSSKSKVWETPQELYDYLSYDYKFTLDPCASANNTKCKKFYTEDDDGLTKSWEGETVFMNPPYGRDIKKWLKKAYTEGQKPNTVVVCLIPSRTDTKYWHDYCMKAWKIHFIKGRLKFKNGTGSNNSAPFPSAVIVFKNICGCGGVSGTVGISTLEVK